jgi:hypothetical protein
MREPLSCACVRACMCACVHGVSAWCVCVRGGGVCVRGVCACVCVCVCVCARTRLGALDLACLQLEQGRSVNERDKNGSTPLMHATWHATSANDGLEIMRLLLDAGAEVNVRWRGDGLAPFVVTPSPPLLCSQAGRVCAARGSVWRLCFPPPPPSPARALASWSRAAESSLDPHPHDPVPPPPCPTLPNQVQNVRLNTALHFAYEKNSVAAVELLLSRGGGPSLSMRNSLGYMPRQVPVAAHPVKQYIQKELPPKNLPAAVGSRAVVSIPSRTWPPRCGRVCVCVCVRARSRVVVPVDWRR